MQISQISEKIIKAKQLKEEGNKYFKEKEYTKALKSYHQANLYITGIIDKESPMAIYTKDIVNDNQKNEINELKFSIWMNMAQIYINQNKYQKSLIKLQEASKIKQNTKLRYRLAVSYFNLGDYDRASELFKKVIQEDQNMTEDVSIYLGKIKKLQKANEQKQKKMFKKFFGSQ